jgi:AGCS family alanine or glycine:cation symporter
MALAYLLVALYVLVVNIGEVPGMLALIVKSAFGIEAAGGGVAGSVAAAMLNGIKRGLFSNEAGMGSAPNIAAVAVPNPHHPSSQGFVQALGVFIDTILICSATGIMILLSGVLDPGSGNTGTVLTQQALTVHIGAAGNGFIAVAILFFAFTSIIGNYAYAESAMTFLKLGSKTWITLLRILVLLMVVWGAYQSVATVFNIADAAMGLMATVNLVAIVALSGLVVKLTRDYFDQQRLGKPRFDPTQYPELAGKIDPEIWRERRSSDG